MRFLGASWALEGLLYDPPCPTENYAVSGLGRLAVDAVSVLASIPTRDVNYGTETNG